MNDLAASAIIAASWVLLAIGVAHGKDTVKALWAMRRSEAKPISAVAAWPCDTVAPCESWVGREITAPVIDEAARIAEYAWNIWEASPSKEGSDD